MSNKVIKMINKKELEIELAKKGADALKSVFEINEKLEKRILELEVCVKLYSNELKHAEGCLQSNLSIIKMMNGKIDELDGRFREHVNNIDVHTLMQ